MKIIYASPKNYFTVFTASITVFLLFSYIVPAIQIDTKNKLPIFSNRHNPIFLFIILGKIGNFPILCSIFDFPKA